MRNVLYYEIFLRMCIKFHEVLSIMFLRGSIVYKSCVRRLQIQWFPFQHLIIVGHKFLAVLKIKVKCKH